MKSSASCLSSCKPGRALAKTRSRRCWPSPTWAAFAGKTAAARRIFTGNWLPSRSTASCRCSSRPTAMTAATALRPKEPLWPRRPSAAPVRAPKTPTMWAWSQGARPAPWAPTGCSTPWWTCIRTGATPLSTPAASVPIQTRSSPTRGPTSAASRTPTPTWPAPSNISPATASRSWTSTSSWASIP